MEHAHSDIKAVAVEHIDEKLQQLFPDVASLFASARLSLSALCLSLYTQNQGRAASVLPSLCLLLTTLFPPLSIQMHTTQEATTSAQHRLLGLDEALPV